MTGWPEPVFYKGLSPYQEALVYTLTGLAALVGILAFFGGWAWVSLVSENITTSKFAPHAPAECSWKEVERDGHWDQTCDENQKRLQR